MKKILLAAAIGALAAPAAAQASCHSFGCLDRQVASLTKKLNKADKAINADARVITHNAQVFNKLKNCFLEVPATVYGDTSTNTFGYVYDNGAGSDFLTGALNATATGDQVGAWLLTDGCNMTPTASVRSARTDRAHIGTPIAPMGAFPAPQRLSRH